MVGGDGNDTLDDGYDDALERATVNDHLIGGPGADEMFGGPGADRLTSKDGVVGEQVEGGEGTDACTVDPGDETTGCTP